MVISFKKFFETKTDYWGTVGAGILPFATDVGKWLVALRSSAVREPNTWGVIGGKIELHENPQRAAKREFIEETRYSGPIQLYKAFVYQSPEKDYTGKPKFVYHNFIGSLIKGDWEPKKNWENTKFEWVTYEDLMQLSPKHYGFKALLDHSDDLIKQISQ